MMLIIYLLVGVLTGLLAMLFGFGGGFVVIPILLWLLPLQGISVYFAMHVAVGTSLMLMLINMSYTTSLHVRQQNLNFTLVKQMLPLVTVGAVIGASLASLMAARLLEYVFMGLVFVVLLRTIKQEFFLEPATVNKQPSKGLVNLVSLITGVIASLLGIGGSMVIVPFFRHYRLPMNKASALANALAIPTGLIGSIIFAVAGYHANHLPSYSTGYIYWPAVMGIFIGSLLGAKFGKDLSKSMSDVLYGRVYVGLLVVVLVSMIIRIVVFE